MMDWLYKQIKSLKVRLLWPVMAMMLILVIVLTSVVTHTYTSTILEQEDAKTRSAFAITGASIEKLLDTTASASRNLLQTQSAIRYASGDFATRVERVRTRQALLDELNSMLARQPSLHGVLFIRENGSAFGGLSERSFFFDEDSADILNADMLDEIRACTRGSATWIGPMSGDELYRIEIAEDIPEQVMLGVTLSRSLSYGTVYTVAVVDTQKVGDFVQMLADGRSDVYLTTGQGREIVHIGSHPIEEEAWNAVESSVNEDGVTMEYAATGERMYINHYRLNSLGWMLIRELPMAEYDRTVIELRRFVVQSALIVLAAVICIYLIWLRGFMRTFERLRKAIGRLEKGRLEERIKRPFAITEFEEIRQEFNDMSLALERLMESTRAMERAQLELELRSLQTQLSPHMIFNSITAIRWMATMLGADRVSDALMELSEMLRPVFRDWAIEWSLGEELQHLQHYSNLLDLRYGNNFSISVEVPEEMHPLRLPRFTLQPLVENSCEHGGASSARLHVSVRAWMEGNRAVICVRDDGSGISEENVEAIQKRLAEGGRSERVGLYSVYNRLRICMGGQSRMDVSRPENGGAEITISWLTDGDML